MPNVSGTSSSQIIANENKSLSGNSFLIISQHKIMYPKSREEVTHHLTNIALLEINQFIVAINLPENVRASRLIEFVSKRFQVSIVPKHFVRIGGRHRFVPSLDYPRIIVRLLYAVSQMGTLPRGTFSLRFLYATYSVWKVLVTR